MSKTLVRFAAAIETLKGNKRNPIAQFMFTLLAEFARLEREVLRERIMSGMEEARKQGKKIGLVGHAVRKAVLRSANTF